MAKQFLFSAWALCFVRILVSSFSSVNTLLANVPRKSQVLWGWTQPMRFSASKAALPSTSDQISNLCINEIQSAAYIYAHASWSQGQSGRQIDFPVNWTPLKKALKNKSHRIYNAYTQESNQKMGLLPTASLFISLFLPFFLLFCSHPFLAKPRWMLNCHRSNPAWLWEMVQFQIRPFLQKIMIWSGIGFNMKPVHNMLHVLCVCVCEWETKPYVWVGLQ